MRDNVRRRTAGFAGAATIAVSLILGLVASATPADAYSNDAYRVSARWAGAVDTNSKSSVNAAYWSQYAAKQGLSIEWLGGSLLGCLPGLTSLFTNNATLSSLNYVRSLAGLAPVSFSSSMNAAAQRAALIMAANRSLSHSPSSSWRCWSSTGAAAAGRSNLALAYPTLKAGRIIDLYMDDPGGSNTAAGHRRWLLNPFATVMGSGSTSTANALTVMGPTNAYRPNPRWVGWPSAGYFPNAIEPSGRWSLSSGKRSVSFAYARVFVYRNGVRIPVHKYTVHNGYAQPTVVWQMPAGFSKTSTYTVVVTRIKQRGVTGYVKAKYIVRLFTPSH